MSVIIPVLTEYVDKGVKGAIGDLKKLGKQQLAAAVSATALIEVGRRAIQAANEDAASQKQLAVALRNSTFARQSDIASVEDNIGKLQYSAAVADDELRPALATLVRVTKDSTEAQDLLGVALDISASTGRDLQTVAISLSRAYQGNVGALRRLGLAVSDGAVANKDFEAAMAEVSAAVDGASEAAASGAEGGWKKLKIAGDDLLEVVGNKLNDSFSDLISVIVDINAESNESAEKQGLLAKGFNAVKFAVVDMPTPLELVGKGLKKIRGESDEAAKSFGTLNDKIKQLDQASIKTFENNKTAAAQAAAAARLKAIKEAAEKAAKANKERLATAVKIATERLEELTKASDDYANSVRDSVLETISLADAVSQATASEDTLNAALQERKEAYEELAKLQAVVFDAATGKTMVADAEDLADAMERVRLAEEGVVSAQGKRVSYTQAFREQINAAKDFAGSLQQLITQGLGQTGLQQLLNLGPVAGAQVAKDILAGTAGLSVADLNLTGLTAAAAGVGTAAAGQMFGADITAAQNTLGAVTYANDIKITVTSADPDKVVEALVKWAKKNGKLPASIKVS